MSHPRQNTFSIVAGALAQAVSDLTTIFVAPYDGKVISAVFIPDAAITGANTNTRKISIVNKGQAGAGTTEMAALQFDSGVNGVAQDAKTITNHATAANRNCVAGDVIAFKSDAVASGLADPGGMVVVTYGIESGD